MPRVLVVDDSSSALQMAALILEEAGYQVTTCLASKRAAEMVQLEAFDLVVTDIYMPEEDGLELIRKLRRNYPLVPIVAMSGMTGKRDMLAIAMRLGACQTIQKPFSKADLIKAIGAALGNDSTDQESAT